MIYTNHRSIPVQDGLSVDSAMLLTEMVGVEPTRPCGPIAFRVKSFLENLSEVKRR